VKKKRESTSPTAALAERIEQDLGAIRRALRRPLESAAARGHLTLPQTAVMRLVVRSPGIVLRDLSREISLAHSTVSGIVDRLEKRGLIQRRADPADGRVMRIFPTPAVTSFVRDKIPRLARGPLERALAVATKSERAAIASALRRLRELLDLP
jgi:DNA-binding MarR family transcriptional regulator